MPAGEFRKSLESRLASIESKGGIVRGERLLMPSTVSTFYQARRSQRAWTSRAAMEQVVESIRNIENDGLTPADYHLDTLLSLMQERPGKPNAAREVERDLLLTDAVAGLIDHVRYGKVRPVRLDPRWNVDSREGAPPLEQLVEKIATSGSVKTAIDDQKPSHFIYRGLTRALAQLRDVDAAGGWPRVPAGKSIKPGAVNARLPVVRRRLAVTGEYQDQPGADSARYDPALAEAVALFQRRHRLGDDRVIDQATIDAMNVSASLRLAQVRVNLERSRWVLGDLSDDFILVNLPAFKVYRIHGGKNVWETRSQIGKEARQTPEFRADMRYVVLNPDWTVPPTIFAEDVLESIRKDGPDVLAAKELVIVDAENHEVDPKSVDWESVTPENFPYTLRQPPGDGNALGQVKFLFPNPYSIYLHDTPHRELFDADQRTFSSGCIRIEHPLELAEELLRGQNGWNPEKIQETLATKETKTITLEHKVPVLIVYWTVSVGATGEIRYMQDVYDRDPPVLAALEARPRHR